MENTNPTNNQQPLAPNNYLVWAILATILCCWPLGIPAIVYAAKVDRLWYSGYRNEALAASNNAKKWTLIAAITGAVVIVLYVIFVFVVGIGAAAELASYSEYSDYYYY